MTELKWWGVAALVAALAVGWIWALSRHAKRRDAEETARTAHMTDEQKRQRFLERDH